MPSWRAEGQLYLLHMILGHVPWLFVSVKFLSYVRASA